jgi:hypothetical protein
VARVSTLVRPATTARFGDVAAVLGPKDPAATVCWCKLFEDSGFTKAADTRSVAGGFPRVLMRLSLR